MGHDDEAMGIGDCEFLVVITLNRSRRVCDCHRVEPNHVEVRKFADEGKKLDRAPGVVAAKKPAVSFGDDKSGRHQRRR